MFKSTRFFTLFIIETTFIFSTSRMDPTSAAAPQPTTTTSTATDAAAVATKKQLKRLGGKKKNIESTRILATYIARIQKNLNGSSLRSTAIQTLDDATVLLSKRVAEKAAELSRMHKAKTVNRNHVTAALALVIGNYS